MFGADIKVHVSIDAMDASSCLESIKMFISNTHCIIFLHCTPSKVREFSNNSIEPGISASGEKLQGVLFI